MSKQEFKTDAIIFYVHGHSITVNPGLGYVYGALLGATARTSVLTIEKDEATGKIKVVIDRA
jgi:hypothetical protein